MKQRKDFAHTSKLLFFSTPHSSPSLGIVDIIPSIHSMHQKTPLYTHLPQQYFYNSLLRKSSCVSFHTIFDHRLVLGINLKGERIIAI